MSPRRPGNRPPGPRTRQMTLSATRQTPLTASAITLPAHVAGSGNLDRLVDTARDYARASTAENTNKAYAADWKHFARWCRRKGTEPLPPSPEMIGLYLTDLAAPTGPSPALSASRPVVGQHD